MAKNSESKLSKFLLNLSNYLISATILCYVAGFAITNLYLGTLGIINLDILRSRYILAGLLFLLFLGAIGLLVYGLIMTYRKHKEKPPLTILWKVLWTSLQNIFLLYFTIPAIGLFAGSTNKIPEDVARSTSTIPWEIWLNSKPQEIFRGTFNLFILVLAIIIVVILGFVLVNPKDKDGARKSRRENISDIFTSIKANFGKFMIYSLVIFLGVYIWLLIPSVIQLISTGNIDSTSATSSGSLQGGWARYFSGIVLVYLFIALFILSIVLVPGDKEKADDSNPIALTTGIIYLLAMAIIFIVPLYSTGIYPHIPQQIGGGQMIPIEMSSSSVNINAMFSEQGNETFLVDRAPNNTLFLIRDKSSNKYKVIEISNNLIDTIVFYKSP